MLLLCILVVYIAAYIWVFRPLPKRWVSYSYTFTTTPPPDASQCIRIKSEESI